jgi:heparan-sulfate lyase
MKKFFSIKISIAVILILNAISLKSQNLDNSVFSLLNLDYKGLEEVKKLHESGKDTEACAALLSYYKNRASILNPDLNLNRISISKEEQGWADDAMEHKFFSHEGFKPSLFYGKDIDWNYWPVKDNELRWQLHRLKWFIPMGKAFRLTGDEKWAQEWVFQYLDWIKKNPLIEKKRAANLTKEQAMKEDNKVDLDNMRYAWRPLEVSNRLQNQYAYFQLFNSSKNFTPEFFSVFLANNYKHANYIINNYSEQGNHLLFEAQRILYAGILFPEFKDAPKWRKSAIDILNREMDVQIYDDGMQNELDPMYHLAMINVFNKALNMADINGYRSEFPQKYKDVIEKMIAAYYGILLPDLSMPMFSDTHEMKASEVIKNSKDWAKLFPVNQQIRFFATEGKEGTAPASSLIAMKNAGFYSLRSGWDKEATAMVYKGGPAGEWHCQLDNGTFNLMAKGRNFFPDAGSYSYGGDDEVMKMRNWFRQTKVHNTLTLNDKNLEKADTKCLLWKSDKNVDMLVTENPSYHNLSHRRSVFFVDKKFYVIVDEAVGDAKGKVAIHYQMCEGDVKLDLDAQKAFSNFNDGNNLIVKTFSDQKQSMTEEEGWVSYESKVKKTRKAFAFNVDKQTDKPVRYITVILPIENAQKAPEIKAAFQKNYSESELLVSLKIGKQSYKLNYQL